MKKHKILLAFFLVLISLFFHFYLMNTHYNFVYGGSKSSVCSINETLNCESVSISPYAYILGIPLATLGFSFHIIFILFFAFYAFSEDKKQSSLRWIKTLSVISLAMSLVMGAISFLLMNTYCVFCMSLYVLSVIIFLLLWWEPQRPRFIQLQDIKWKNAVILFFAIPVLAFLVDDMNTRDIKNKTSSLVRDAINNWENAPSISFQNPILTEGAEKSSFTIVEFADFQCIHCRDSVDTLHSFVRSRPLVQMQFYSFPLDGSCNPKAPPARAGAGKSCLLARAVYCSQKQGRGWQAHKWIFDRFGSEENSQFENMTRDLKLDDKVFRECIVSDEAFRFIEENTRQAVEAKIDSTPSIFVNGKKLDYGNQIFVLDALYKKLHSN